MIKMSRVIVREAKNKKTLFLSCSSNPCCGKLEGEEVYPRKDGEHKEESHGKWNETKKRKMKTNLINNSVEDFLQVVVRDFGDEILKREGPIPSDSAAIRHL
jgi:ssDNA-binding Zn-finger/Zn-ribbon topoisomerase 1